MNILILGSMRTKSSALGSKIHREHPGYKNWGEPLDYITVSSNSPIIKDKQKYLKQKATKIIEDILSKDNNIIKVVGANLSGLYDYIEILPFDRFEEIHLTERKDFFDQCCSIFTAKKKRLFHNIAHTEHQYVKIKHESFTLSKERIVLTAKDIYNYIMIKKFLIANYIKYQQHSYEDLQVIDGIAIRPTGLEYNKIFTNYNLKDEINFIFTKHFNYKNVTADLENFKKDLEKIIF